MPFLDNVRLTPEKPAVILGDTGEVVTYRELDERSMRVSQVLSRAGLEAGDAVAVMMGNNLHYHEILWGVLRSEMYFVPMSRHLTADEAAYMVHDSGARALVVCDQVQETAEALAPHTKVCPLRLALGADVRGFDRYETRLAEVAAEQVRADERLGDWMLYSSGTTGRPLGIRRELRDEPFGAPLAVDASAGDLYRIDHDSVFLTPAPLYHSAPLCFTAATHSLGGTTIITRRFDAVQALNLIERYQVTTGQWVPSMFVRMLKLPASQRDDIDVSSQRVAVHGAGPCAPEVKRQMIDWWGPILVEYFGSTEFTGLTRCDSDEWLRHPGTVGKPILGVAHICGEDGRELQPGEQGRIYFEREIMPFAYHNAPERTAATRHPEYPLWTQVGDIGYLDEDGYLYAVDRASFVIISGGVNIYPQEVENALLEHPAVLDAAVFGIPHEEMGEQVQAVVQTVDGTVEDDRLVDELDGFLRARIAGFKLPRSIDFTDALPRHDNGKLYKRLLRDRYLEASTPVGSE